MYESSRKVYFTVRLSKKEKMVLNHNIDETENWCFSPDEKPVALATCATEDSSIWRVSELELFDYSV